MTRDALAAAAVLAFGTVVAPTVSAAPSALSSPCPSASGVTVVVDFGVYGGVEVRCAPGAPRSGFDALRAAGFSIQEVARQPGFLCRIEAAPPPEDDACVVTPPGSRYWSYHHAPRGGAWTYSTSGASRRPTPGSVEGWAFGAGASPSVAPPPPAAPPTTSAPPSTTRPPVDATDPSAGQPSDRSGEAGPASAGHDGPDAPGASSDGTASDVDDAVDRTPDPADSSGEPGEAGDEVSQGAGADEVAGAVGPDPPDDGGSGSPVGAVVALVAVSTAVAVGLRSQHRRSQAAPGG